MIGPKSIGDTHENITFESCSSPPEFVLPALPQETCLAVPPGSLFMKQITATSHCSNVTITSIKVFAPIGTIVGDIQHIQGTNHYYVNVAWLPAANQQNDKHLVCVVATSSLGLSSVPLCMQLAVGYYPPSPVSKSATHQLVYPSSGTLSIAFDRNIQRPSATAFIKFYKLEEEIYRIDASLSTEITFDGTSLTIVPNYMFSEKYAYNVNFDGGVVQSVNSFVGCQLVNEPISIETFWTFTVIDMTPGKKPFSIKYGSTKQSP